MIKDTKIGGPGEHFPATRWSAIAGTQSKDPRERNRAFDALLRAYWKPVYKTIRVKWNKSNEDAKDLTQGFFAKVIEKGFLSTFDPGKARFRTFLRTCLEGFLANQDKAARRIKRGGDRQFVSLDFALAEQELARTPPPQTPEEAYFEREWVRSLFALTVDELQKQCERSKKTLHFKLFESYDLRDRSGDDKLTYEDLARQFELRTTTVTNYLAYARREFRRILLQKLREITLTDEEFRTEAQALLGIKMASSVESKEPRKHIEIRKENHFD